MKAFPCMIRWLAPLAVTLSVGGTSQAGALVVTGSPEYNRTTRDGFRGGGMSVYNSAGVNNAGTAVGWSDKYVNYNTAKGQRGVRWNASGTDVAELGILGDDGTGYVTEARANAVNDAGTAVGHVTKYVGGISKGVRAVRWDASGTAATELDSLYDDGAGNGIGVASAINDAGTAVGRVMKYVGGKSKGYRAVRWDASGTAATELGILYDDGAGYSSAQANAVNNAGTVVGSAYKYVGSDSKGSRAVRWDASGTVATELGALGEDSGGSTSAFAFAINDVGTAAGWAHKYVGGSYKGRRAVRWDASGTAATELGILGDDGTGYVSTAQSCDINEAGTVVGYLEKYVGGSAKGWRAVRWDASGTAATELGILGDDGAGNTETVACAVNDVGTTVGYAAKYVGGVDQGNRAVIWLPDTSAIDLNNLIAAPLPGVGAWTLTAAVALSADGYVAGLGDFDLDGTEPAPTYGRLWVTQVGLGGAWTNPDGGTWGRGPNWSTGTPAMQVGDAVFDLDETYTVDLDRDELTKTIAIDAGTVTIDFNGHTLGTESGLDVGGGATLKGAGTILGDVQNAGTIAPGNSPGSLDLAGSLENTGILEFEIAGDSSYDRIDVTGSFSAGGSIMVKLDGYAPVGGDLFDLMDFADFVDNGYTFDLSHAVLSSGLTWDTTSFATTGNIGVVGVPEPSSLVLFGMGVVSLLACARRSSGGKGTNPGTRAGLL